MFQGAETARASRLRPSKHKEVCPCLNNKG